MSPSTHWGVERWVLMVYCILAIWELLMIILTPKFGLRDFTEDKDQSQAFTHVVLFAALISQICLIVIINKDWSCAQTPKSNSAAQTSSSESSPNPLVCQSTLHGNNLQIQNSMPMFSGLLCMATVNIVLVAIYSKYPDRPFPWSPPTG